MNRALVITAALSVFGAVGGWIAAPPIEVAPDPVGVTRTPSIDNLRDDYARARALLGRLSFMDEGEEVAVVEAPPPPDIAQLFRRDLTAIENRADGAIVWVVDFTQQFGRRGLRVGDVYQDGWRVAAIEPQAIVLRRRRERRRVDAFVLAPEPNQ